MLGNSCVSHSCTICKYIELCLGVSLNERSFQTDRPGQLNEAASHENLKRFVEWGGNFFDTANVYSRGESEKVLGTWLSS